MQVLSLAAENGVDPANAKILTDYLSTELGLRQNVRVFGTSDIQALLREAQNRQSIGCTTDADLCLAEVSGALGAQWLVTGTVGRLGAALVLNVRVLDTHKRLVLAQGHRVTSTEQSNLLEAVRDLVPELFRQLSPESNTKERSPVPYLLGSGALVGALTFAIAGGVAVVNADANASARSAYLSGSSLPAGYPIASGSSNQPTYSTTQSTIRTAAILSDIGLLLFLGLGIGTAVTW